MSLFAQIRGGLASAQPKLPKHVNTGSFHHAAEKVQNGIHSMATGLGDQVVVEKQGNSDNVTPSLAQENCPDAKIKMTGGKDAPTKATAHSDTANAVTNDDIVGECSSINPATQDTGVVAGTITQLRKTAWENPLLTAATVVTGTGLLVVAAPAIVTAPIISLAGAAGFTSGGIAATSAATTVHASIGNVAAGSIFATLQSAAAGGYGVGVLTGAAQTAGGAVAGAGGLGGILAYLKKKGKSQPESTDEKKD
ncbi:hypothetical protein Trisim1_001802 [Trichoderma cf. simile WF8]|uniref:Uncharacterized protein n=1 Tax=Trichoderma guizhouense TaxID=1491466 RepID=A0A1T3CSF8_9HYPO|nr:hypothetical protein A0O28_0023390 [Trichoderma guizhouense]